MNDCSLMLMAIFGTVLFTIFGYGLLKSLDEKFLDEKHEDTRQILKVINKSNIYFYIAYILFLAIITIKRMFTKNVKFTLIVICILYLIISFIIWFFQFKFYYNNAVEKKDLRAGQMSVQKIKIIRSILVAISGWLLILVNVVRISKKYIHNIYM